MNDIAKRRDGAPEAGERLEIDRDYMLEMLDLLLRIPSPSGFTDNIVRFTCQELDKLGIAYELTRRGAIRADLTGDEPSFTRAIVAHLDTLGAMVKNLKDNGRLEVVPIGHWSARFAEGTRVTVYSDDQIRRGTILPLKASGHVYGDEIDSQPTAWENLEIRLDEKVGTLKELIDLGFAVGDFVSIDPQPEFGPNGFINARHLDDKAGVAALLAAAKAIAESGRALRMSCHLIFTIAEEVGVGVSGTLHGDISEMVAIDNGTIAPGQNTNEYGVTIAAQDMSGPFDHHLVRKLIRLCQDWEIPYSRDVFKYYRSDSATALEAGNDLRHALVCFALDSSHGYERTHEDSMRGLGELLAAYMLSEPTVRRDEKELGPLTGFPTQPR